MTKKIFMLLAVVLLSSASAFAQSNEPLKGDVNGDGVVDVAAIVAVIDIIQNGEGSGDDKTYYWYVGTTKPTSLSDATVVTDYESEVIYTNNSGAKSKIYALTNKNKTVLFYNPQFNTLLGQVDVDTTTIPGYKIYETEGKTGNTGTIKLVIF